VACGPGAPEETTGSAGTTTSTATGSSSAPDGASTGSTATTDNPTTGGPPTGAPTTGADPTTTDASATTSTSTTTPESSSIGGVNDTGVCMVDPKEGICSDSCDDWLDCCQCAGKTVTPMGATECTIAMGIVTAVCPWSVWNVYWDGEFLQQLFTCDGSEPGWTQRPEDGDIVVELCGDSCAAYMQGSFGELHLDVFCEAA